MASQVSQDATALINQLTKLGDAYKSGEPGSREGLLGVCSKLISELSHPTESLLRLLWAEPCHHSIIRTGIDFKLFDALASGDQAGQKSELIASKCEPQAEPLLVGEYFIRLSLMRSREQPG
jgi:hypothetical protein